MMSSSNVNRREFLRNAALGAAAASLPLVGGAGCQTSGVSGGSIRKGQIVTGRKLNIACIGCGGQGNTDAGNMGGENVVAVCDVDWNNATNIFRKYPDAKRYKDFRQMLTEMDEQIDAVTVTTPDHTHYPAALMAIELGKHVYVQKPMTHTVAEARALTLAARKHGVVTQMGNQGHSNEGTRLLKEWIQAGAIGKVREVHIWTNRPIWPQGMGSLPKGNGVVPETLDWNRWLGVAPYRPYHSAYMPFKWRGWWDYGCGALGDMGCHTMDAAFWALDLGSPVSMEAESGGNSEFACPTWSIVTYQFPARGDMPPVKLVWYDGGKKPPRPTDLEEGREMGGSGQLLIGDEGKILDNTDYCSSPRVIPESKMKDVAARKIPKTLPRVPEGHWNNWIKACKGETTAVSNFDYAGPLTETVNLGNVAIRLGKKFDWDGANLTSSVAGVRELVTKKYRVY